MGSGAALACLVLLCGTSGSFAAPRGPLSSAEGNVVESRVLRAVMDAENHALR